jgi:hypothetical protein
MMMVCKICLNLKGFLKHDLDSLDLFSKLKVLKEILQIEESAPIDILNYIKKKNLILFQMHVSLIEFY